jgi:hypothetical protein
LFAAAMVAGLRRCDGLVLVVYQLWACDLFCRLKMDWVRWW